MPPRTWVILSDKKGDNGQLETLVNALGWPVEYKRLQMLPQFVIGKPRYRPSLAHIDPGRSDRLQAPWPELIITVGRRPSMAALWVRRQSGQQAKIVLLGKPVGRMADFALVVASAQQQIPPLANYQPITLPLMRVSPAAAVAAAAHWQPRFAALRKPLIALLVGGATRPFIMNRAVAAQLVKTAHWVIDELGGTPYVSTSRRTAPAVVKSLREQLPAAAQLFEWSADAADNPYRALLGSADGFIVTGDSVSMMVEVIYLRKPLAIFPLPSGRLGGLDQLRRTLAHWLCQPRLQSAADRWRQHLARAVYHLDVFGLFSRTRDFRSFHRLLVARGLAVWAGTALRPPQSPLPDDIGVVVRRIEALFPQ